MPTRFLFIILSLVLILILGISCDDRGTGIPSKTEIGTLADFPKANHSFDSSLTLQLSNTDEVWQGTSFIPISAFPPPTGQGLPTPILILLPPQDANQNFYQQAGLITLAQEMIASKEIEPMIIQCPANATAFGGMFYGNSAPAGFVDTILAGKYIEFLENLIPASITSDKSKRGIAGIGMGAYGAYRAAILSTDTTTGLSNYGSVSGATGPLDFDGSGGGGLAALFPQAVAEQQQLSIYDLVQVIDTTVSPPDTTFEPGDTFAVSKFDSGDAGVSLPLSRLFIGGSVAFSPHDTGLAEGGGVIQFDFSQVLTSKFRAVINMTPAIESTVVILDSTTFVDSLIQEHTNHLFGYHLPFDDAGTTYSPIWSLWMQNNLDSLYLANGANKLDATDIFIANNPGAKWNYSEMTQSWISFLQGQVGAQNVEVFNYSGPNGTTYTGTENVYDVLREMLIFHSNSFKK